MDAGVIIIGYLIYGVICGAICSAISSNRGMAGGFWWGFFLGIIGIIIVAVRPNENSASKTPVQVIAPSVTEQDIVNSLKEYKGLYDSGVITEEEFLKKKEQLLSKDPAESPISINVTEDHPAPVRPITTDVSGVVECPVCGEILRSGVKECWKCGAKFT